MPFPFANFALYPFAVINFSCEYKYMLSPVNPPSESLNLGVVLETPNTYLSMFSSSPYNFAFCIQIFNPAVIFFFFDTWRDVGNLI